MFFACPFSDQIWQYVRRNNDIDRAPLSIYEDVGWIDANSKDSMQNIMLKLSLAATVYAIWIDQNSRIRRHKSLKGILEIAFGLVTYGIFQELCSALAELLRLARTGRVLMLVLLLLYDLGYT